jgi:hypothetical protein
VIQLTRVLGAALAYLCRSCSAFVVVGVRHCGSHLLWRLPGGKGVAPTFQPNFIFLSGGFCTDDSGLFAPELQGACRSSPCLMGGACLDDDTENAGYTCACAWGYSGDNCEL